MGLEHNDRARMFFQALPLMEQGFGLQAGRPSRSKKVRMSVQQTESPRVAAPAPTKEADASPFAVLSLQKFSDWKRELKKFAVDTSKEATLWAAALLGALGLGAASHQLANDAKIPPAIKTKPEKEQA